MIHPTKPAPTIDVPFPEELVGSRVVIQGAQIMSLCTVKFGVTFPMLAKILVKGPEAHPLFQWLAQEGGFLSKPRWNFYKYIIGRDGHLKDWFSTLTGPTSHRFKRAVTEVIAVNA